MDRPSAPDPARAAGWIRHGRARLNLAMRWATRAHSLLSVGGAAQGPARQGVALASAAVDLALVRRLRRSDRPELAIHAAADLFDLATWTALSTRPGPEQLSTAMNSGHPLAIEVGARHRWAGLAVPLAGAVVAGGVARARGRRSDPAAFVWQVAAALGGAGLSGYVGRLRSRRLAAHEVQLQPQLERAELSAQNDVALGIDNLVDEVQRAGALIQLGAGVPAGGGGTWKAGLAAQTRRSHRYLVDVLLVWQRQHNAVDDLSSVVVLEPAAELVPVVLDAAAADELAEWLDGAGLRGRVAVSPSGHPGATGPSRIDLIIGPYELSLDTGVQPVRLHVDPLPGGLAWLALWLAAAGPQDGVPARAALGPAIGGLGLMAFAHRAGRGPRPAPAAVPAVLGSTVLTIVAAAVQTATVTRPRTDPGIPRIPASLSLRGHAFVTALARPDLPAPVLALAWAGGAAALAVSWSLTPPPRPVREFLAELTWVAMSATMARSFTEGIAQDAADLEAWVATDDERRRREAGALGRHTALAEVRTALDEVLALEAEHGPALDPPLRAEARRRLQQCVDRLAELSGSAFAPLPA